MSKSETSDFTLRFRTQPNYGEYQCDNSEIRQLLDNRRFIQLQLKLPQAVKKSFQPTAMKISAMKTTILALKDRLTVK